MTETVRDKIVVVTGASAGVGRALVRELAARGADVGMLARSQDGLDAAADEVRRAGRRALAIPTDVADAEAVERAAAEIEAQLGPIDVWVNNAMVTVFAPAQQVTPEEFRRVTDVSYLGYVWGTQTALRRMTPRDRGTIVQVGSALAYRSIPLQSAYCGAKAAIRGFTDSLRSELIHDGSHVRLTMVQLPAVNTPQFTIQRTKLPRQPQPVPPIFTPELIARAIVWAAEHAPRELTVGGSALQAIVGQKLIPGSIDWYLARTAYEAQQTGTPVDPDRPDNLFEPVPGDHGADGPFDACSTDWSAQLWARTHLGALAASTLGLGAAAGIAAWAGGAFGGRPRRRRHWSARLLGR